MGVEITGMAARLVMNTRAVAPLASAGFRTSAPAQGIVSTIGTLGCLGMVAGPAVPQVSPQYAALKDEYKTLLFMGGMTVFGTMASMGGSKEKPAAGGGEMDSEVAAFFASLEEESK